MSAVINICSDVAEGAGHDEEILPLIDSANVCCGIHAGSLSETIRVARRCYEMGVEVGAHPGYDDRENYGREETGVSAAEIEDLVRFQVAALAAVVPLGYIKAHGALYHRCQADPEAAAALVRAATASGLGLVGQPGFPIVALAREAGLRAYREGFADRAYLADGRLAPRSQPGAVLDQDAAVEQALRLARSGDYDTICFHGDSPGSHLVARAIRDALNGAGIATNPLGG